jgi:hypothetical protein
MPEGVLDCVESPAGWQAVCEEVLKDRPVQEKSSDADDALALIVRIRWFW